MTRFLSHIFEDALCGTLNEEIERLFAYHQATKHTYQSVRTDAHFLDWKNQPNPFRVYEGAPVIALPCDPGISDAGTFVTIAALDDRNGIANEKFKERPEIQLDLSWISRLLWHSMAISAWKKVPGSGNRYSLRVNPSSGNLHPTETYLALRGFREVADGLYHYRVDSHAIELRNYGSATQQLARALELPGAEDSSLIVGLTSIFWREAWKYRDRAYRYCCHDLGHAMMSVLLAARALGVSGSAIAHFGDARLTHALGLDGGDEAPMAFLVFSTKTSPKSSPSQAEFAGSPNELSDREIPYQQLLDVHRATILPDSVSPLPASSESEASGGLDQEHLAEPVIDAPLGTIVRRRRSALDFDPRSDPMQQSQLEQLLDFSTRDWRSDWRGNLNGSRANAQKGIDFITLYVYVHRVRGCDRGVYRWERTTGSLTQLHQANVERIAAYLSLEQALAGNSCFTVSMIANLADAAQAFGNRGYRYIFFEAGAIGQRLYLGAEALNLNATGIGAFYDDDVHRYLGFLEEPVSTVQASVDAAERQSLVMLDSPASRLPLEEDSVSRERLPVTPVMHALPKDSGKLPQQVIYHFAVGRAILDPRIEG